MKHKKRSIIYVLKILKTCSSKDYPISQSLITRALNLAGIICNRKTVARDIDCLIMCGYKITKLKGGGCFLYNKNALTNPEIALLEELILGCDLDSEKKIVLLRKLKNQKREMGITAPSKNSVAYFNELNDIAKHSEISLDDFIIYDYEK